MSINLHTFVRMHMYMNTRTQYLIYGLCLQLSKVKYNGMDTSELTPDNPCLLLYHTPENYEVCFARGQTRFSDLFLTNNIQPIWWECHFGDYRSVTSISLANSVLPFRLACLDEASFHVGKAYVVRNWWTANDQPPSRKWIRATARSLKASPSPRIEASADTFNVAVKRLQQGM